MALRYCAQFEMMGVYPLQESVAITRHENKLPLAAVALAQGLWVCASPALRTRLTIFPDLIQHGSMARRW